MLLSDIDSWNVGALQSIAFELGDELKTVEGVAADLGQFGPDPTSLPLEQLSSTAATSPSDNVPRDGASSHADYPRGQ